MPKRRQNRVTCKDVARKANVTGATVSMALHDRPNISAATKARIREISRELGYKPPGMRGEWAQVSLNKRVERFGFFLIISDPHGDPNLAMIRSLTRYTHDRGIRLETLLAEEALGHDVILNRAIAFARPLGGLLLTGLVDEHLVTGLARANIPTVVIGHITSSTDRLGPIAHCVETDSVAMGRLAAATLLARGHRRIAFICMRMPPGLWNAHWLEGYRLAHLEAGVGVDDRLVYIHEAVGSDGPPVEEAMRTLSAPPTACLLPGDASRLLPRLLQHGVGISRQAIVIGAIKQLIGLYWQAEDQVLWEDMDVLTAVAVQHLRQVCVEPSPCPVRLTVSFGMQNMPMKLATPGLR